MHPSTTASSTTPHDNIGLPSLFKDGSKATMYVNVVFQKGYIKRQSDNTYRFSVCRGPHPPTDLRGVPLHEFEKYWDELIMEETLFLGNNLVSSFLRLSSSPHQPHASFISDCYLIRDCPASLMSETHANQPDRDTCILSY